MAAVCRQSGAPGRMELIEAGQPFAVIVDYAHTPASLDLVLRALRPLTPGRLIAVFGSAGERDRAKRPMMGRIAATHADFFVLTDEDPRGEDRAAILAEIAAGAVAAGARQGTHFLCCPDRRTAIRLAFERASDRRYGAPRRQGPRAVHHHQWLVPPLGRPRRRPRASLLTSYAPLWSPRCGGGTAAWDAAVPGDSGSLPCRNGGGWGLVDVSLPERYNTYLLS